MPTANNTKKLSDSKYAKSEKGKITRAKAWKKYASKPEIKQQRLEQRRKLYKRKGLYHNKYCDLYQVCIVCNIEKRWLDFSENKKTLMSRKSECKKCNAERSSKYRKNNREKINKARNKRLKSDHIFKMTTTLRKRTGELFRKKNFKKNKTFHDYIGCTVEFLSGISSKFKEGMTWDNHGEWHIDHIIPLSVAKTEEEIYKLSHYTNLQPLWSFDNFSKGNKILKEIDNEITKF